MAHNDFTNLRYTNGKKDGVNTQPSWLGVCVYLLKRSKTCTSSGWIFVGIFIYWSEYFVTEEFFYMNRSLLQNHSTCHYWKISYSRGTGPSLANPVQRSYALEGEAWPDQSCVPAQRHDLHGDQTMFGWGPSWFSCFKLLLHLGKEHLLSWLWHLMPQFLLKCVNIYIPENEHGSWKSSLWKGNSYIYIYIYIFYIYSTPSFFGFYLSFRGGR